MRVQQKCGVSALQLKPTSACVRTRAGCPSPTILLSPDIPLRLHLVSAGRFGNSQAAAGKPVAV